MPRKGKTLRQRVESLGHQVEDWDETIHDVLDKLEWQGTMTQVYMGKQEEYVAWRKEAQELMREIAMSSPEDYEPFSKKIASFLGLCNSCGAFPDGQHKMSCSRGWGKL